MKYYLYSTDKRFGSDVYDNSWLIADFDDEDTALAVAVNKSLADLRNNPTKTHYVVVCEEGEKHIEQGLIL